MRTVFLGTSEFASTVLGSLAGDPRHPGSHRPALVLTRPDRPAGRGRKLVSPPVATAARALGIELAQPESVNDPATIELIASSEPDVVVVCAFGALVKEPLLTAYELLNVHPSLLPRWRGAAPIERAIMAGDERTGVSIMRLTAGLDSGPVCLTASEPILPSDTYGSLAPRLAQAGGALLREALDALARGESLRFVEQDEQQVTYAEKIASPDRLLDPANSSAAHLERVVRALHPHIGARLALPDGTLIGVHTARVADDVPNVSRPDRPGGAPVSRAAPASRAVQASREGLYARDDRLLLGCGSGTLELLTVQPAGGKPMQAAAYLRGRHGLSGA